MKNKKDEGGRMRGEKVRFWYLGQSDLLCGVFDVNLEPVTFNLMNRVHYDYQTS